MLPREGLQEFARLLAVSHRCQVKPEVALPLPRNLLLPPTLGGVAWLARLLRLPALFAAKFLQTVCDFNIESQLNYSPPTQQQFDAVV